MMMRRILFSMAALALTPLIPALSNDDVKADTRVSVSIGGGFAVSPGFVVGFSYNDPYVLGHVHRDPVFCDHGPLYYYPAYRVYGHYHPRYAYSYYARPRPVRYVGPVRHGHGHHVGCDHGVHGRHRVDSRSHRGRGPDRSYRDERRRDDRRGNDRDDRRGDRQGQRVRGH